MVVVDLNFQVCNRFLNPVHFNNFLELTESKGYQYGGGGLMYSHKRKMGFGRMPLFIPVVIPMGGIGRHRNSYRYDGMKFIYILL